jgi:quercetin 2,3-dioxygenase
MEIYPARATELGALTVRRALPVRGRRMIGAWCFLDLFGPLSFSAGKPMDVAPHPHIGLQTVTWLLAGEVLHRDSLRSEALIRPGELNLMTAGRGIAHTEETPRENSGVLSGVQLWTALPETVRAGEPAFEHQVELPGLTLAGGEARVFMGEWSGARSPARAHSPMVGAELVVRGELAFPLESRYEHGLVLLEGDAAVEDVELAPGTMYYLAPGRNEAALRSRAGARVLLIGGEPFGERVMLWWNFAARSAEEMERARADWEGARFAEVPGYRGPRLRAPELVGRLRGG